MADCRVMWEQLHVNVISMTTHLGKFSHLQHYQEQTCEKPCEISCEKVVSFTQFSHVFHTFFT